MKKLFVISFLLFAFFSLTAFEGDKDIMKTLKKENKLKKVIPTTEKDGYEYYLLVRKGKKSILYGIADKSGKVIVPPRYNEIDYHEALEEGIQPAKEGEYGRPFWGYGAKAVFFAKYNDVYTPGEYILPNQWYKTIIFDEVSFYDLNGNIVSGPYNNVEPTILFPQCYGNYYIEMNDWNKTVQKNLDIISHRALFTSDGKMLTPFEYYSFFIDKKYIEVKQIIDKVTRVGAILVDEDLKKKYGDTIPCVYHSIYFPSYSFGDLKVQTNETEPFIVYNPSAVFDGSFKDDGEKYFSQREWDKVLDFYATRGVNAPWAKYFSGKAFYMKAHELEGNGKTALYFVENVDEETVKHYFETTEINFENAVDFAIKAKTLSELYIATGDDDHKIQDAKTQCRLIEDMLNEGIPESIKAYNKAQKILAERDEARLRAAQAAQQAARERQAAFWGAVLQGFVDAIGDAAYSSSSNSSTYAPNVAGGVSTTSSYSSSSTSSSSSSSGGSGGSGDAVAKAKAKTRISELKNQIHTYEGLLRDAEAFETKCRAEKSNFLGQAIKAVNNYKKKLKDLNDEMNNLKSKYGL